MYTAAALVCLIACGLALINASALALPCAGGFVLFAWLSDTRGDEAGFFGALLLLALIGVVLATCMHLPMIAPRYYG